MRLENTGDLLGSQLVVRGWWLVVGEKGKPARSAGQPEFTVHQPPLTA